VSWLVLAVIPAALLVLAAMVAVMTTAWWFQRIVGNAGWIDVFWTYGTGAACVAVALVPLSEVDPSRQVLVAILIAIWSLRLGTHIARRVARSDEDLRYVELRKQWEGKFQTRLLRFVMLQPPVSALLALSVYATAHHHGPVNWRDFAGLMLLGIAIAGEAVADEQMRRYKLAAQRPDVMDRGLWGRSRHPNYFFEWLVWMALPVIAFTPGEAASWPTLLAPVAMYLVLCHGTGVPMLEASMLERKGDAFRDYQGRVNVFFPSLLPPR
jgi:steroid 5-alpha reductase family enzyme